MHFYSLQKNVKLNKHLEYMAGQTLDNDYIDYQVKIYNKRIKSLRKEIAGTRADQKQNDQLKAKLNDQLVTETPDDQINTRNQIDEYTTYSNQDKVNIANANKHIEALQERIGTLQMQHQ